MAAGIQVMPERLPGFDLRGYELPSRKAAQPGGSGGDQLDRATQYQGGGGTFAPRCPPFVVAMGTKTLLQVVIGPWEIRDLIAVKEAWPVAPGHLEEVDERRRQGPDGRSVPHHRAQQTAQATFYYCPRLLVFVGEDMSYPMDPVVGKAHIGPQGSCLGQAPLEECLQSGKRLWESPLFATPSRLWEIVVSRSCSLSPEAARGGCPSSVRALRTALQ